MDSTNSNNTMVSGLRKMMMDYYRIRYVSLCKCRRELLRDLTYVQSEA